MGLTDFLPFFRVEVDGQTISKALASRLVSLSVHDAAGVQSDTVEIVLSDTGLFDRLAEPAAGAEIKVWMGYALNLKYMGLFIADSVEVSGPPDQMVITGTAAINGESSGGKSALTDQKKRSWPAGTKVGDLVSKIAQEHSLEPVVAKSLEAVELQHLDQIDESDMALLTRVARDLDAIAKPGDGKILLAKRGESVTASGDPMPVLSVREKDLTQWQYRNSLREKVGSVIATYQDNGQGKPVEVRAGEGKPEVRLKRRFPSESVARRAAAAELARSLRAGRTLSLQMPGDSDAVAEARLNVKRVRSYIDGEWLIVSAVHRLDQNGFTTRISAEQL